MLVESRHVPGPVPAQLNDRYFGEMWPHLRRSQGVRPDAPQGQDLLERHDQRGLPEEFLSLFGSMKAADIRPDHFTFTSGLNASAQLGDILFGGKVHASVVVSGYSGYVAVSNALIDMYGKCSSPDSADRVFREMVDGNDVSCCSLLFAYMHSGLFTMADIFFTRWCENIQIAWNVMITGLAEYGEVESCIRLFNKMNGSPCEQDILKVHGDLLKSRRTQS